MKMHFKSFSLLAKIPCRIIAVLAVSTLLASCGGGGGSDSSSNAGAATAVATSGTSLTLGASSGATQAVTEGSSGSPLGSGVAADSPPPQVVVPAALKPVFYPRIVDTTTGSNQHGFSVGKLVDGSYLVVWSDNKPDGTAYIYDRYYSQRYSADGTPVGNETLVAAPNEFIPAPPSGAGGAPPAGRSSEVVPLPDGGYVVAYAGRGKQFVYGTGPQENDFGIFAQRFTGSGTPVGLAEEIFILHKSGGDQGDIPPAALLPDGGYVFGWPQSVYTGAKEVNIYSRRFSGTGRAVGGLERVNSLDVMQEKTRKPRVAALKGGGYVFIWVNDTDGRTLVRRYDADGIALGSEQAVKLPADYLPDSFNRFKEFGGIAASPDGGYLLTGVVPFKYYPDGYSPSYDCCKLVVQRYAADGSPMGSPIDVSYATDFNPQNVYFEYHYPSVSLLEDGSYEITWQPRKAGDIPGTYAARRLRADGSWFGEAVNLGAVSRSNLFQAIPQ